MTIVNTAFDVTTKTNTHHSDELLIVDVGVQDSEILIAGLAREMDVVFLKEGREPLGQIAQALGARFGTHALHILAHGEPGALLMAGITVDADYLRAHAAAMSTIKFALMPSGTQTPILALWACSVGWGEAGESFSSALEDKLDATVFAATGPVGAKSLGGDWRIGTASPFKKSTEAVYPHML